MSVPFEAMSSALHQNNVSLSASIGEGWGEVSIRSR